MSGPTPIITGTRVGQPVTGQPLVKPFSGVTITDANGQIETLTVTLSNNSNGTFANLAGADCDAPDGIYSVVGTAAQVQAATTAMAARAGIGLGNSTSLFLAGVDPGPLHASNFALA
jgi:hypothetical protein